MFSFSWKNLKFWQQCWACISTYQWRWEVDLWTGNKLRQWPQFLSLPIASAQVSYRLLLWPGCLLVICNKDKFSLNLASHISDAYRYLSCFYLHHKRKHWTSAGSISSSLGSQWQSFEIFWEFKWMNGLCLKKLSLPKENKINCRGKIKVEKNN